MAMDDDGVVHRVAGTVRRAVGALGRAARGATGRAEAGTDVLFQKLHADHEEVSQLFEKLMALGEGPRAQEIWRELSIKLATHARAEQQTVYEALSRQAETSEEVAHSFTEHAEIEDLLLQLNAMIPGTPLFHARLPDLERAVRRHVDDEEGDLLPRARQALSDEELEKIVARFETRKFELMPLIEGELAVPRAREEAETDLESKTYDELMKLARKREIPGRSKMKKKELVRAIRNGL
jgi:hemerythrin superfamily protein